MTRNWAEMKPEEFEAPAKEYLPVDLRNVEGDLSQILHDHIFDYFEPLKLDRKQWELASYEDSIPDEDLVVFRRVEDGLMVEAEITVSVTRYQQPESPASAT